MTGIPVRQKDGWSKRVAQERQILNFSLLCFVSHHSGEKLEAAEFISVRVMDGRRVDGLGQDQEQAVDGKEE